jgi:hypothetical protein
MYRNYIPDVVKIGGMEYDVEITSEPLFVEDRRCKGLIEYEQQRIRLADDSVISPQTRTRTFWHEVLHGILSERNFDIVKADDEETIVEELAIGIHQFIVDNNLLFVPPGYKIVPDESEIENLVRDKMNQTAEPGEGL